MNPIQELIQNPRPSLARNIRGAACKEYILSQPDLTSLQKDALVGGLLGDGTLNLRKEQPRIKRTGLGNFPNYKFDQGYKEGKGLEYVNLIFGIFFNLSGSSPTLRFKLGKPHSWSFRTFRVPAFEFYENLFYEKPKMSQDKRRKKVPKNIYKFLNPRVLAFWFMDDGSKVPCGYRLNTQGFSLAENKILQKALGDVFNLQTNIQKDTSYYQLYIPASHKDLFTSLIAEFCIPTMHSKLHFPEEKKKI
jgi:hypothetical protein